MFHFAYSSSVSYVSNHMFQLAYSSNERLSNYSVLNALFDILGSADVVEPLKKKAPHCTACKRPMKGHKLLQSYLL